MKQESGMRLFIVSAFASFIPGLIIWITIYNTSATGDDLLKTYLRWVVVISYISWCILVCVVLKIFKIQRINSLTVSIPIVLGMSVIFLWQDQLKTIWLVLIALSVVFVSMMLTAYLVAKIEDIAPIDKKGDSDVNPSLWTKKEKEEVKDYIEF